GVAYDRRRIRCAPVSRVGNGCQITGVLGGATENGLLVKCVCRIGETRWPVTARFRFVKVRMENDVCAALSCIANRLRITPTFMTDHHTKPEFATFEHLSS